MKKTPFFEEIQSLGGKMVDFAGYSMAIQFANGIISEHKAVRQSVGLFDVSHMGEFLLKGKNALDTLQYLITNDISNMVDYQTRYTLMLDENGGVIDDILVYRINAQTYMLVVNASNKDKDETWVSSNLIGDTTFEDITESTALLALQGRNAIDILNKFISAKDIPTKSYYFTTPSLFGEKILLSRTGYTGEDGFEIYSSNKIAMDIFQLLQKEGKEYGMALCGLGARDTLRLEAGMPLYGNEMSADTLASELGLNFFIKMQKPNFIGKQALLNTAPKFSRKGFKLIDRGIAREGSTVYANDHKIGTVTSGTHSPTLGYPIGMVRIEKDFVGEEISIEVRNKKLRAKIVDLPFYKKDY